MVKIGAVCLTILLACLVVSPAAHAYVTTMGAVTNYSMFPGMACPPPACCPQTCCPPACCPQSCYAPMCCQQSCCAPPMPCPPPNCYKRICKVKQAPMAMAAPVCGPSGCCPPYSGYGMPMGGPPAGWY